MIGNEAIMENQVEFLPIYTCLMNKAIKIRNWISDTNSIICQITTFPTSELFYRDLPIDESTLHPCSSL
jgi:hypothetical protein